MAGGSCIGQQTRAVGVTGARKGAERFTVALQRIPGLFTIPPIPIRILCKQVAAGAVGTLPRQFHQQI